MSEWCSGCKMCLGARRITGKVRKVKISGLESKCNKEKLLWKQPRKVNHAFISLPEQSTGMFIMYTAPLCAQQRCASCTQFLREHNTRIVHHTQSSSVSRALGACGNGVSCWSFAAILPLSTGHGQLEQVLLGSCRLSFVVYLSLLSKHLHQNKTQAAAVWD